MRAFNVFLSLVVSLLIGLLVLEGGLRLIGKGPPKTLNRFDSALGWSKAPNQSISRAGKGWTATFAINEHSLREDAGVGPTKPRPFRVIALGDSFTLGFTVEREDLFVDLLENKWRAEGRALDVINAGTEGYSTDQEAVWLARNGAAYKPDLVLLFPYENDIFWNGETRYQKFEKPRHGADGVLEERRLLEPAPKSLGERFAVAKQFATKVDLDQYMELPGNPKFRKEFAPLLRQEPEFVTAAVARVKGSLIALQKECAGLNAKLVVVPIPSESCIDPEFAQRFATLLRLSPNQWSPDKPVDTYLALCKQLGIAAVDARPALQAAHTPQAPAYLDYFKDHEWHFTAHGNHEFAKFVAGALEPLGVLPPASGSAAIAAEHTSAPLPRWPFVVAGLWLVLSIVYAATYPKEPKWQGFAVVGCMLALVTGIFLGLGQLTSLLGPQYAKWIGILFVGGILSFVVYKLGGRILTVTELLKAFVLRGHWYLMPLVVVLLTIGSLLVVAASSPFVAPFIYTLF